MYRISKREAAGLLKYIPCLTLLINDYLRPRVPRKVKCLCPKIDSARIIFPFSLNSHPYLVITIMSLDVVS